MAAEQDPQMRMYAVVSKAALKAMGGNRGKLGAQLGHAFMHAGWDALDRHPARLEAYRHSGSARKVVLLCEDEDLMRALVEHYRPICGVTAVVDAGYTVFTEPTFSAIGIGPLAPNECDERLRSLPVLI